MDARVVELLNLELDGRLDAAGRAELEAALANDPAARTRREQLRAVARALADAPVPSLPPGFREEVLRRLPQRSNRAGRARRFWRGGLALAASVVAAAVVLQVVQHEPAGTPEQLGATLAPPTATVTARPQPGGVELGFVLPPGPADLVIDVPGTGPLAATADRGPAPAVEGRRIVVRATGGRLTVQVAGDIQEFNAVLVRDGVVRPVTPRAP
jgi:anti-sigma factor RsiW